MGRNKNPVVKRVRVLNEGLIDEEGLWWERVRTGVGYYLTAKEARLFIGRAVRFMQSDGIGAAAFDLEGKTEFKRLAKDSGHRVQAYQAADASKRIIVTVDPSDC